MYATLSTPGARLDLTPENDFISDFFALTSASHDVRSPELFRRWCGLALLAAACERRVWVRTGIYSTYLNMYTFLVGTSGIGKQVISSVRQMAKKANIGGSKDPALRVSPTNMTSASLVDNLAEAEQERLLPGGKILKYSSLFVVSEEFAALMSQFDKAYIGILNDVYNNPDDYEEGRRGNKEKVLRVERPGLNILAGIQPAFMGTLFPEEIWSTGMMRRFVMVFSNERRIIDPFAEFPPEGESRERVGRKLNLLCALHGELSWSESAARRLSTWIMTGENPQPTHSKLDAYNKSRTEKIIRLAALSLLSRTLSLREPIALFDLERAFSWLFEVEAQMGEVFKSMLGRSDQGLVEELWRALAIECARTGKAQPTSWCWRFIGERTTHDKIEGIMRMAQKTNQIEPGDILSESWKPKGKHLHTPE